MKAKYSAFSATKEMHGSSSGFSASGFQKKAYILLSLAFMATLAAGSFAIHKIPPAIFFVYLVMSVVTIVVYAMDKHKATNGKWRIPEATLHLFELLCGGLIFAPLIRVENVELCRTVSSARVENGAVFAELGPSPFVAPELLPASAKKPATLGSVTAPS